MHTVYLIENLQNGKFYTGQTSQKVGNRWGQHKQGLKTGKHSNRHLQGAWSKYGAEAFLFYAFDAYQTKEESDAIERALKKWFDELGLCYNILEGGERRAAPVPEETRQKISAALKGRPCRNLEAFHSPEAREKIRLSQIGRKHPPRSDEFREKQRIAHLGKPGANKGRKLPPEQIEKMRQANLGREPTAEARANMKAAQVAHSAR